MAKSFSRGHIVISVAGNPKEWVYEDTQEPLGAGNRSCRKCGAICDEGDPDPCLGELPGVANACCGHGKVEESYINFTNGITIRGFKVIYDVEDKLTLENE